MFYDSLNLENESKYQQKRSGRMCVARKKRRGGRERLHFLPMRRRKKGNEMRRKEEEKKKKKKKKKKKSLPFQFQFSLRLYKQYAAASNSAMEGNKQRNARRMLADMLDRQKRRKWGSIVGTCQRISTWLPSRLFSLARALR